MVDAKSFNDAYVKAINAASTEERNDISARGLTVTDFCTSWPKIRYYINLSISMLAIIAPGKAAMVRAFVTAITQTVIPMVCPKA